MMRVNLVPTVVTVLFLLPLGCNRNDESSVTTAIALDLPTPASAAPSRYEFESPVRVRAGADFVSVDPPGFACPTMADVDGDGMQDLVVGQFHQGHLQFCKNVATEGESPRFAAAEWIKSGDERAIVPGVW